LTEHLFIVKFESNLWYTVKEIAIIKKMQEKRTKKITIAKEPVVEESAVKHYELHIASAAAPTHAAAKKTQHAQLPHHVSAAKTPTKKQADHVKKTTPVFVNKQPTKIGITIRIWNFLEWLALSALIFAVFFFAINYQSYAELLHVKLAKLTGTYQVDPYIEEAMNANGVKPAGVDLLPLQKTTVEKKQPLPELNIGITPPDDRIIIPRINRNVPIVNVSTENLIKRDWSALEAEIQNALRDGVVHYPGTAEPGERGNVVITGHSSYFPWDPGRFKDVFALLHDVSINDEILIYADQKQYKYKVTDKKIVMPDQIDVLTQQGEDKLTLITCTPVGTNLKRLIIIAKPIVN
jgi:LPXTG-site transpeptidase (sortase) family protein